MEELKQKLETVQHYRVSFNDWRPGLLMENKSCFFLFIDIWSIFMCFGAVFVWLWVNFLPVIGSHIHSKYEVKTREVELE